MGKDVRKSGFSSGDRRDTRSAGSDEAREVVPNKAIIGETDNRQNTGSNNREADPGENGLFGINDFL